MTKVKTKAWEKPAIEAYKVWGRIYTVISIPRIEYADETGFLQFWGGNKKSLVQENFLNEAIKFYTHFLCRKKPNILSDSANIPNKINHIV